MNPFQVLLRHRNFRLFWAGQTTSLVGSWMQSTAQAWLALELTGDPFWVTLVYASSSLPVAVISLFAGVVVDRYDKLRLVTGATLSPSTRGVSTSRALLDRRLRVFSSRPLEWRRVSP